MDTVLSSCKIKVLWQVMTGLVITVITTDAKIKGRFECTARRREEITCLEMDLSQPSNGQLTCPSAPIREGGVCNLTCDDGYYPFPSNRAVCGFKNSDNGGEWLPVVSCRQIDCGEWNEWNGKEYKLTTTGATWSESLQLCGVNDSLVTIENEEENEFVRQMLSHCDYSWPWIGLNDRNIEGTWVWSDGKMSTYRNWERNEPNMGEGEDCVGIRKNDGKWYNENCNKKTLRAVCERGNPQK